MEETPLSRPLLFARTRRALVTASMASGALFAGGMLVGAILHNAPRVERISMAPAQVTVAVPQAAAPAVSVNVPAPVAPAPVVVEPAPTVPPAPRPLVPRLWAQCVDRMNTSGGVCEWDDGFPAIASDGTLIATKYIPDDGGRGYPGLSIHLLDTATGTIKRSIDVLSPDEYVEDDGTNWTKVQRLRATIAVRLAAAQKLLDDGGYRTMAFLGTTESSNGSETAEAHPISSGTYGEVDQSGAVRIIDPTTNSVIWQHQLGVPAPRSITEDDDGGMCPGWGLRRMSLWWDPATRFVISSQDYQTGGCMCNDETVEEIAQVQLAHGS
jgi:hypothetical protein